MSNLISAVDSVEFNHDCKLFKKTRRLMEKLKPIKCSLHLTEAISYQALNVVAPTCEEGRLLSFRQSDA